MIKTGHILIFIDLLFFFLNIEELFEEMISVMTYLFLEGGKIHKIAYKEVEGDLEILLLKKEMQKKLNVLNE